MYKYKNVSGTDQSIVGLGLVPADTEFDSSVEINNPNFELVGGQSNAAPREETKTQEVEIQETTENGA